VETERKKEKSELETVVMELQSQLSVSASKLLKSTSGQIRDGGWHTSWTWLNCCNAAADCEILLKSDRLVRNYRRPVINAENDWQDGQPQVAMHC